MTTNNNSQSAANPEYFWTDISKAFISLKDNVFTMRKTAEVLQPSGVEAKTATVSRPIMAGETKEEAYEACIKLLGSLDLSNDVLYPWRMNVEVKVSEQPKETK